MEHYTRVFAAVTLLTPLVAAQELQGLQCDIPTSDDVRSVGQQLLRSLSPEGGSIFITTIQMHYTCLATVALDKYSWASVVINFTDSNSPGVPQVEQFQMRCVDGNSWQRHPFNGFDSNLPSMPFEIQCLEYAPNTPNYDADSNCQRKHHVRQMMLLNASKIEADFALAQQLTTVAHSLTMTPVVVWRTAQPLTPTLEPIRTLFVVSRNISSVSLNFTCSFCLPAWDRLALMHNTNIHIHTVCNISCEPGYTRNTTSCSCKLADGCEAAGQPCLSGQTCVSDLSAPPYYSCQDADGSTGQNCQSECTDVCIYLYI